MRSSMMDAEWPFRSTGAGERVVWTKPADHLGNYRVVFIPDYLSSDSTLVHEGGLF
jgi:hypothetical protein